MSEQPPKERVRSAKKPNIATLHFGNYVKKYKHLLPQEQYEFDVKTNRLVFDGALRRRGRNKEGKIVDFVT